KLIRGLIVEKNHLPDFNLIPLHHHCRKNTVTGSINGIGMYFLRIRGKPLKRLGPPPAHHQPKLKLGVNERRTIPPKTARNRFFPPRARSDAGPLTKCSVGVPPASLGGVSPPEAKENGARRPVNS